MAKLHNVPICKVGGSQSLKLILCHPPRVPALSGLQIRRYAKCPWRSGRAPVDASPCLGTCPGIAQRAPVRYASSVRLVRQLRRILGNIVGAGSCWWCPRVVPSRYASAKCFAPPAHHQGSHSLGTASCAPWDPSPPQRGDSLKRESAALAAPMRGLRRYCYGYATHAASFGDHGADAPGR